MRFLPFFCGIALAALTTQRVNTTIHQFWDSAMDGDATKYRSFLADNVVVVTNGEEDDAPWQQESFIKGLFSKVRYREMKMTTPVGYDAAADTFIFHYQWSMIMLATGQEIDMGLWSQRVKFDAAGKIVQLTNVGLAQPLNALAQALSSKADFRDIVQGFVTAINAGNAQDMHKFLTTDFVYASNGKDVDNWEKNMAASFSHARWRLSVLDYAQAGPDEALVNVQAVVEAAGSSVSSLQGWQVGFNATGTATISSIVAIQDSLAAHETQMLLRQRNKL